MVTAERTFGPSDLGGVKPKELLEILILARGRPVTKEALADKLWPRDPPKNAPGTLETYVSVLRKKLFSDRSLARRVLVTSNGAYKLSLDDVSVDLDEFDLLIARSERLGPQRLELLRQAASLARGCVLEDAPMAPWVEIDRELYRDRVTRVNVLAAGGLIVGGDYTAAIKHAERALEIRPYAEEAVRALMLANHGLGQSELARQVYDRCCGLLANELNLDCSTETADLAGAIGAGATIGELLTDRALPIASPPLVSRARERRDPQNQMPFVGRGAELDRVRRVIERSAEGHFSLVLLRGRPGVGRTAFLTELDASLSGPVGRVSYSPLESERPKLPLVDALRDALRFGDGLLDAERYAGAALLSGGERILSMLADLLRAEAPMVLLLDDFQWADMGTVSAIDWLRRSEPQLPVTIVGAVRDAMPERMSTLDLLATSDTVRLSRFDEDEWRDLDGIDPSLARAAGGWPSLMADCYRWRQAGNTGQSPSLREEVLRMARGLGGIYPELLQAASVQPEPFGPADLCSSNGSLPLATLDGLEQLCDFEILEQVPRGFRFRAPIVSDVIAGTIS